jgi:hypothetical protein
MDERDAACRETMRWVRSGPDCTAATVALAVRRAGERGIDRIVVASNTGATAEAVRRAAPPSVRVVCVSHQVGFRAPGEDEMPAEARRALAEAGVPVLTTTHFLAGVDRALRMMQGGHHPADVVAMTLRMLGQGLKVAVEIAVMAADAGLVPPGLDLVSVGGTGRGADTAAVIRPAHGQSFFDTRVVEILCRPFG